MNKVRYTTLVGVSQKGLLSIVKRVLMVDVVIDNTHDLNYLARPVLAVNETFSAERTSRSVL